jgi:protein-histidine pros-kinase
MSPNFDELLLKEISDAIIAKSSEGRVIYWGHGAERVFGYSSDEAVGRMVSELIIPPDRKEEEASILKDVLLRELSQYETTRCRKDGLQIYVDVSSKAVRDEDGRLQFILSTNKDVTRLKVERDTKLVEARFGSVLESVPDGIIMADSAGRIVLANSQAERLFGYGRNELLGEMVEVLLPARFRHRHVGHRTEYAAHPRPRFMGAGLELFGLRKDGTEFPAEIMLSPLETEQGNLVMSAIRDVSDRKEAERKFRDQAKIINLVNDTVFVRDFEDRVTYWNKGAQRVYGWTAEEVLGQVTHEVLKTAFPQPLEEIHAQLLADEHWEGELEHTRRDGSTLTVSSRWTLQRDAAGVPAAIIELNYDITDRKRFETTLREKNIELENAATSKNKFLANMSHELRTPLNGIIGFAEFLVDGKPGPLNARQKDYLGDILNSGRHLLQLINDILDLSKVEANRMDFHPEPFSVLKAIEGVCAVAKPIAQKKHIPIRIDVAPELDEAVLDPQKFKQVLYNLLSNAIKFTNEGGSVQIRAARVGEDRFSVIVQDTGIGIRQEDIPRLFNEFEQLESGVTRRYDGTGLGLALTKKIVELQGGTITLESEFGCGASFTVVLPNKGGHA